MPFSECCYCGIRLCRFEWNRLQRVCHANEPCLLAIILHTIGASRSIGASLSKEPLPSILRWLNTPFVTLPFGTPEILPLAWTPACQQCCRCCDTCNEFSYLIRQNDVYSFDVIINNFNVQCGMDYCLSTRSCMLRYIWRHWFVFGFYILVDSTNRWWSPELPPVSLSRMKWV